MSWSERDESNTNSCPQKTQSLCGDTPVQNVNALDQGHNPDVSKMHQQWTAWNNHSKWRYRGTPGAPSLSREKFLGKTRILRDPPSQEHGTHLQQPRGWSRSESGHVGGETGVDLGSFSPGDLHATGMGSH